MHTLPAWLKPGRLENLQGKLQIKAGQGRARQGRAGHAAGKGRAVQGGAGQNMGQGRRGHGAGQGRAGQGTRHCRAEQSTNLSGSSGCHTLLNCSSGRTSDSGTKPQLFRVMNRPPPAIVSWGAFSCSFPAVFFSWLRRLPILTTLLMLFSMPSGAAFSRRFCCCLILVHIDPTPARQTGFVDVWQVQPHVQLLQSHY